MGCRLFSFCGLGFGFCLLFGELCLVPGLFFLKVQALLFAFGLQLFEAVFFRDATIPTTTINLAIRVGFLKAFNPDLDIVFLPLWRYKTKT